MTHLDSFNGRQVRDFHLAKLGQDDFVSFAVSYLAGVTAPYRRVTGFWGEVRHGDLRVLGGCQPSIP